MKKPWLLLLLALLVVIPTLPVHATPPPVGLTFDHVIIVAMENELYSDVIGSSNAPFINSLAQMGSAMSGYHSYGQVNSASCSAGCYEAVTSGQQTKSDGWCNSNPPCLSTGSGTNNLANQLNASFLSSAMFCEDSCPRHADHFPWLGYSNTYNSCVTTNAYTVNCNGQSGSAGDHLYNTVDALCTGSCATCSSSCSAGTAYTSFQSNAGDTAFINHLNSANPADFIWLTPTDCHNMHDSCGHINVPNGDFYLGSLLCGCSAWNSTAVALSGTVFASSLWTAGHTILMLWWDEYDPSPQVVYGPGIKANYVSSSSYGEYYTLHTIERNWGLPYITSIVAGDTSLTDVFTPALVATGPAGVISCDGCNFTITYYVHTVDLSGVVSYTTTFPNAQFQPVSGTTTLPLDGDLNVNMAWIPTHCTPGWYSTTIGIVGSAQQRIQTHVNCAA